MPVHLDSTQISNFFQGTSRQAHGLFPELIRRLVFAQSIQSKLRRCRFPAGDQIREHGFDGYVSYNDDSPWIPGGNSLWEVGTDKEPQKKAQKDWKAAPRRKWPKAENRSEFTWIFVTPHSWPEQARQPWIDKKKADSNWADVKVLDATDLEAWLDQCPTVSSWLAEKMELTAPGIIDTEQFLDEFIPHIGDNKEAKSQLVIGGRTSKSKEFQEWLLEGGRTVTILGESREEAALFAASSAQAINGFHSRASIVARMSFVESGEYLKTIVQAIGEAIVIPITEEAERKAFASKNKRLRVVSLGIGRTASIINSRSAAINLERLHAGPIEKALCDLEITPKDARIIATESKGSIGAVLWALNSTSHAVSPSWSKSKKLRIYAALWLAGQWDPSDEEERSVIADLSGRPWEDIQPIIDLELGHIGQFEKFGSMVDWKAWPFCLDYVAPAIDDELFDRFKTSILQIFAVPDPREGMSTSERFTAELLGVKHPYSKFMRAGLLSSLTMLAILSTKHHPKVEHVVQEILSGSGKEQGLKWATVGSSLGDLAEASPRVFIRACYDLAKDEEAFRCLFEGDDDPLFSKSSYCNILWALECLAWSPDYLPQVVDVLAIFEEKKKKYGAEAKISNSPLETLKGIFLPWHPSTLADEKSREEVFLNFAENHPAVAWEVACKIKPSNHGFASWNSKPKWHDWLNDWEPGVTTKEFVEFSEFILSWMMEYAKVNPACWKTLIDSFDDWREGVPPKVSEEFVHTLSDLNEEEILPETRKNIFDALRGKVNRHREFSDVAWAMSEEELKPLDALVAKFSPDDAIAKNLWLFDQWPELADRKMSIEERDEQLSQMRQAALEEILTKSGGENLFQAILENPHTAWSFGITFGKKEGASNHEEAILEFGTKPVDQSDIGFKTRLSFLEGYVLSRYSKKNTGEKWAERIIKDKNCWSDKNILNFLLCLPTIGATWRLLDSFPQIKTCYWEHIQFNLLNAPQHDLAEAVTELLAVNRPCKAMDTLSMALYKTGSLPIDNELVIQAITNAPYEGSDIQTFSRNMGHHVDNLLSYLEKQGVDDSVLGGLEWPWMSALEDEDRGMKSLKRSLATEPNLLVDILKLIFKAENEETKELSEADQQRAQMGYRLLSYWDQTPGSTYKDDPRGSKADPVGNSSSSIYFKSGDVNYQELLNYCTEALKLAAAVGRFKICASKLGGIIAHSPKDDDGGWPHESACKVIEELNLDDFDHGIVSGVINKRGAHMVAPNGSGEKRIAEQFRAYAAKRSKYSRTENLLQDLAETFERQATQEQEEERHREFWG